MTSNSRRRTDNHSKSVLEKLEVRLRLKKVSEILWRKVKAEEGPIIYTDGSETNKLFGSLFEVTIDV